MAQIIAWSLGLALQLVGVFIALVGVLSTQREYKDQDEPWMLDWVFSVGRWIAGVYTSLRAWVLRVMFRRPDTKFGPSDIGHAPGQLRVTGVAGTVQTLYSPLDDKLSLEEKVKALDARSRADRELANRLEDRLQVEHARIDELGVELEARTVEAKQHASETLRAYATKGIKASALGLFVTALGMVCSAFAQPPWV